jgi:hypothetical protein
VDVKEQYQVTIRNKPAPLENLENNGGINRAWDNMRQNITISAQKSLSYCESRHRKPWFDEECSKLTEQRKVKLQWSQDPSEMNENNFSNIQQEARKHFRNKREYLKE